MEILADLSMNLLNFTDNKNFQGFVKNCLRVEGYSIVTQVL